VLILTADNYAWMLTNNYFNKTWNWTDNGYTTIDLPDTQSILEVAGEDTNSDQSPEATDTPMNCPSTEGCEYLPGTNADYVALRTTESLAPIGPFYTAGGCVLSCV
jgi:hypothetical protein